MTRQIPGRTRSHLWAFTTLALLLTGCGDDPRLSTQTTRIANLLSEVDEANNQLKDAAAQLQLARQQLELVTLERNDLADAVATQNNASSAAAKHGEALESQLRALRDAALKQAAALDMEDAANLSPEALVAALGQAAAEATAALPPVREELARLSDQVKTLTEERRALKDGWDTYRRRAMSLEQYVPQRSDALAVPYKQALSSLTALQQSNRYLEQQLELFEAETLAMTDEVSHLSEELEAANQAREALEIATRELNNRVNRAEVDARRSAKAEKYVYELFEARTVEATKLKAALKVATTAEADLAGQLSDVLAERDGLVTELAALAEDTRKLKTSLTDANANLARTSARAEETGAELTTKVQALALLEKEVSDLKADAADAQARIAESETKLTELTALSERLRSQVANTEAAANEAHEARKAAEARASDAAAATATLTAERDELRKLYRQAKVALETPKGN